MHVYFHIFSNNILVCFAPVFLNLKTGLNLKNSIGEHFYCDTVRQKVVTFKTKIHYITTKTVKTEILTVIKIFNAQLHYSFSHPLVRTHLHTDEQKMLQLALDKALKAKHS